MPVPGKTTTAIDLSGATRGWRSTATGLANPCAGRYLPLSAAGLSLPAVRRCRAAGAGQLLELEALCRRSFAAAATQLLYGVPAWPETCVLLSFAQAV